MAVGHKCLVCIGREESLARQFNYKDNMPQNLPTGREDKNPERGREVENIEDQIQEVSEGQSKGRFIHGAGWKVGRNFPSLNQ